MEIDKAQILDFLRHQKQHDQAAQAEGELPDKVDTDRDSGLLDKFGVNPQELIAKFSGGKGGSLGGLLGG